MREWGDIDMCSAKCSLFITVHIYRLHEHAHTTQCRLGWDYHPYKLAKTLTDGQMFRDVNKIFIPGIQDGELALAEI